MSEERMVNIREEINRIDSLLLNQIEERFKITDEVGRIKSETNAPIYVPEREQEILNKVSERTYIGKEARAIWKIIIRGSSNRQYGIRFQKLLNSEFGEAIKITYKGLEELALGKKPVLQLEFADAQNVNDFLQFVGNEGFYPLELKVSGNQCTTLLGILNDQKVNEDTFMRMLYNLCNEFTDVRLVGWA